MKKILLISIFFLAVTLRFYRLGAVPPGLYIDEVSIGNNAYSILKTGNDEYGEKFPLWFKSLGDYKPPLYIYLTSLSMAVFGKNEFAIRFPSAFFGSLTIIFLFLLIKKITQSFSLAALSSILLSISPWHLQFSRGGFEVNVGLTLFLLGTFLIVKFWEDKKINLFILSILILSLTPYTYHTYRIVTPLWVIGINLLTYKRLPAMRKQIAVTLFFFILISLPFIKHSLSPQGQIRFAHTSAFVEYPIKTTLDKVKFYPPVFLKNYLTYFSFPFLFSTGDGIGRHQVDNSGPIPIWQLPFLLLGVFVLARKPKDSLTRFIIALLIIAPIPGAIARPSPHTLRSLLMVIPLVLIVSQGILYTTKKIRNNYIHITLVFIIAYETISYFHNYYVHYPNNHQLDWGGAYKELVNKTAKYSPLYTKVLIDERIGEYTNLYFQFYNGKKFPEIVSARWEKSPEEKKKNLFLAPQWDKKTNTPKKLIDRVTLTNPNKDVVAEFWEI